MPDLWASVDNQSVVRGRAVHQTIRIDPDASAPIYIGWAPPGTDPSVAAWSILRCTYSGPNMTRVEWADGNILYDNVWDNRAAYPYS